MNLTKPLSIGFLSATIVLSSSCEHLTKMQDVLAALNNKNSATDSYAESDYSDESYADTSYSDESYSDASYSDGSYSDTSASDSSSYAAVSKSIWAGVCLNRTTNVSSPMLLSLHRQGNFIQGAIKLDNSRLVCAPLFKGAFKGERFTFVTPPYGGHGRIIWTGIVADGYMRGVYRTASGQSGTFLLRCR